MTDDQREMTDSDFLKGMDEEEMAFYAKFKLPNLSREKKVLVRTILENKGLTRSKINAIVSRRQFQNTGVADACMRCGSYKTYKHESLKGDMEVNCLVCDYIEKEDKNSKFNPFWFLFRK